MRRLAAVFALLCLTPMAAAQEGPPQGPSPSAYRGPDLLAQRAAMARLEPLVGRWQGEANVSFPQAGLAHQTEQVERALDGLALLIRGTGHATPERDGAPVFQALALVSFNERSGLYEFRSLTADGHATNATGEFLPDGAFRWGFSAGGPVRMRFTIRFDRQRWSEIGEMSRDSGASWTQTINLDLRRAGA